MKQTLNSFTLNTEFNSQSLISSDSKFPTYGLFCPVDSLEVDNEVA